MQPSPPSPVLNEIRPVFRSPAYFPALTAPCPLSACVLCPTHLLNCSTDLVFARQVAAHIGSDHHEVLLTEDDFFDAIPEVRAFTRVVLGCWWCLPAE